MIKLKDIINENDKNEVVCIELDMDGVLCNFDLQFKKYLSSNSLWNAPFIQSKITKKFPPEEANEIRQQALQTDTDAFEIIKKLGVSWQIIALGKSKYWSTMEMMPGAKELIEYVNQTGIHTEILTAGNGPDCDKGKREWTQSHGLGNLPFKRVGKGADKAKVAKSGHLLIDDKKENVEAYISAGGFGIIHKNTSQTINELKTKFGI